MATTRQPISDTELLAAISAAEESAIGSNRHEIAADRADAIDRYLGKPYGDEIAGRSSVVSRDVADVVEGVLANVLKPFVSGEEIVRFMPRGQEDEAAAEQESDYVNFVVLERNNGFLILNAACKDALLLRNGYVKCNWTKRSDVVLETYEGLSDDEIAILSRDSEVEIAQHSEYPDPIASMLPPDPKTGLAPQLMLHDVKARRLQPLEFVEVSPVPPDEMLVGQRTSTPSVQDADFVQHRSHVTISYLRQQGYAIDDDINDGDDGQALEETSRERFGQNNDLWDDPTSDPARRVVEYKESYLLIDFDGDGIAERRRVCQVGQVILANEETDVVPFACFTGTLMAHQHLGLSVYDMVADVARLKTALLRQFMDNKYLANNARTAVDFNRVNLDDLTISRPGGIVRVDGPPGDSMFPIVTPDTGVSALQGLEYLDTVRENRTGYTRQTQGLSSDALSTETLGGQVLQLNQSELRLEMVARTIAETGARDLFRVVHALTLKHANKAEKVRLRNKWVEVDPRSWVKRFDLSIAVGMGVGAGQAMFAKLMALAPGFAQSMQAGLAGPQEAYNFGVELYKAAGFKNTEKFIHAPETDPKTGKPMMPPPQPSPQEKVEMVRQQGDAQKTQATLQADAQKFQAEQVATEKRLVMEDQLKQRALAAELEVQKANDERDAAADLLKHEREQGTKLAIARLQSATSIEVAKIGAGLDDGLATAKEQMAGVGETAQTANAVSQELSQTLAMALQNMQTIMIQHVQALAANNVPKRIVRDPVTGKAIGVEPVRTLQ